MACFCIELARKIAILTALYPFSLKCHRIMCNSTKRIAAACIESCDLSAYEIESIPRCIMRHYLSKVESSVCQKVPRQIRAAHTTGQKATLKILWAFYQLSVFPCVPATDIHACLHPRLNHSSGALVITPYNSKRFASFN